MPANSPLVSVIIPAYNQAAYLPEAVKSVFAQTYHPLQVMVINDGSPDNCEAVVQELQTIYPGLEYFKQANGGVCRAAGLGLTKAVGKYILRLDADDYLPENYIKTLMGVMEGAPQHTAYVYTDAEYCGERTGTMKAAPFSLARLVRENYIHVSALVKREVLEKCGYFNPNMRYGFEDWDLWLNLVEHGFRGIYCRDTFLYYRQKKENGRNQMQAEQHRQMRTQIYANHPGLYKRPLNRLRVFDWRLRRRLKSYIKR